MYGLTHTQKDKQRVRTSRDTTQPHVFSCTNVLYAQELREGRELAPDAGQRVGLYRELYGLMREHFGDDDLGRRKAWYFAPWHHSFFHRYR